ncbi:hypothetical protein WMF45_48175 [Sorangium sp. So ce448]|uniref:SBBP repeat-containing protein n=1 Tax=Sorangium sp. So ce448 TaxID=3133314 RepID=UPI003F5E4B91
MLPAVEGCATTDDDESCDGEATCTGAHEWSIKIGGAGQQQGLGVAFGREGNILVAGSFTGSVDFADSKGSSDGFVMNLSRDGARTWAKAFGGSGTDLCNLVARDKNDNVILAGRFANTLYFAEATRNSHGNSDVFVAKLDKGGSLLWLKTIGGLGADSVHGLSVDSNNNIIVAGMFTDAADVLDETELTSFGGEDIFVVKLDTAGHHVWSKNFGDASPQVALDAAVTSNDDVVVVGRIEGTVSFGPSILAAMGRDAFLAKLDGMTGYPLWGKAFGNIEYSSEIEFAGVALDHKGNIVVAGHAVGTIALGPSPWLRAEEADAVVGAYDPDGEYLWSRSYGATEAQRAGRVVVDPAGNVLVVGHFETAIDFEESRLVSRGSNDAFLAKLGPTGETVWAKSFGGAAFDDADDQGAQDVAVDALGTVALVGIFNGSVELGGGLLTSDGLGDAFVAKLRP